VPFGNFHTTGALVDGRVLTLAKPSWFCTVQLPKTCACNGDAGLMAMATQMAAAIRMRATR
jgi:hypothetical protein